MLCYYESVSLLCYSFLCTWEKLINRGYVSLSCGPHIYFVLHPILPTYLVIIYYVISIHRVAHMADQQCDIFLICQDCSCPRLDWTRRKAIIAYLLIFFLSVLIGMSLSEPHASATSLHTYVCMFAWVLLGLTTYRKSLPALITDSTCQRRWLSSVHAIST